MAKELSIQIKESMEQYTEDVKAQVVESINMIGKEALKRVKSQSPERTGSYRRGWKLEIDQHDGTISMTIRQSKKNAPLTHLLENGHRTRNKKGWVKSRPHILSVEEWAVKEAQKAIEKAVKG